MSGIESVYYTRPYRISDDVCVCVCRRRQERWWGLFTHDWVDVFEGNHGVWRNTVTRELVIDVNLRQLLVAQQEVLNYIARVTNPVPNNVLPFKPKEKK